VNTASFIKEFAYALYIKLEAIQSPEFVAVFEKVLD
jgi:hypothetical protein